MNELALFAGAGGGILGGKLTGFKTVCGVEWDPYCQAVLLARQADGILDRFPIWDDIQTFNGKEWNGCIDVITAGFPCQPFSQAGHQKGEDDERNMWPDTIRILREVGAEWALLENVPGLVTSGYFGTILRELAEAGFDAEWDLFSAFSEGAPHLRERLWIVAHAQRYGLGGVLRETRQGTDKLEQRENLDGEGVGSGGSRALGDVSNAQGLGGSMRNLRKRKVSKSGEDGARQSLADTEGKSIGTGLRKDESRRFGGRRSSDSRGKGNLSDSESESKGYGDLELGEGIRTSSEKEEGQVADSKDQRDGRRDGSDGKDGNPGGDGGYFGGGTETNDGREWGTIKSGVGRTLDGLAEGLDGFKTSGLNEFQKWMIGFGHEKLFNLRDKVGKEEIQRSAGRLGSLQEKESLLSEMRQHKGQSDEERLALESEEIPKGELRSLRDKEKAPGSPLRQKPGESKPGKSSNSLHPLPQVPSRYGKEAWADGSFEDGIPRVAYGIPHRVDRLRAIGNGQVPAVARRAFLELRRRFYAREGLV